MFSKFPNFVLNAGKIATNRLDSYTLLQLISLKILKYIATVIARPRNARKCVYFQSVEINKLFWFNVIVYTARAHPFKNGRAPLQALLSSPLPSHFLPGQTRKYACYAGYFHSNVEPKIFGKICAQKLMMLIREEIH